MKKRNSFLSAFVSVVFLFVSMVHCAPAAEPVKIACHSSFTGKSSTYGSATLYATRFEIKKKNEAGGIKSLGGAKIELIEEDNASEPKNAVASQERLASNPEILAIIGPTNTPEAQAAEPITGKYRIPNVLGGATADIIFEHGNKYIFGTSVLASRIGETYARFMMEMQKKRGAPLNRITVAYPDNEYGIDSTKSFKQTLKNAGLEKNILLDVPFDWNMKDLAPVVLKLKAANPDFHLQAGYFPDGKLYHEACFNMGFHPLQVGGMSGFNHPDLWKALGEKIGEVTLGDKKTFAGDYFTTDLPNPSRDAWLKAFLAVYPKVPVENNLISGAIAAELVIEALEMAGKRDREAITEALHKIYFQKDDPRDFMGFVEKPGLMWQPNGKPNTWLSIQQWRKVDGNWRKMTVYSPMMGLLNIP